MKNFRKKIFFESYAILQSCKKMRYPEKRGVQYLDIGEILKIERELALGASCHLYLYNSSSLDNYNSIHQMRISYNPHSFRLVSNQTI